MGIFFRKVRKKTLTSFSRWRMLRDMDDEHNDCNECNGAGSFAPAYFGEREAPDGRERLRCEGCDGTGREGES